ncbi:hypothetical protein [Sphingomonas radiodurans]|uniref:hypothetical protein n=1 Tax=Sphingomonas radiodurans TaxID=2890321 RepID=UPI001E373072|nr:hypothetical protein [Sphingomonas radiodurans]WBH15340.1 hypothetical protein LLW23_10840 [Sphingomonas radiodurans]
MDTTDDHTYFSRRADRELDMAQRATSPQAVKAHYALATFYLGRVHGLPDRHDLKGFQFRADSGGNPDGIASHEH